MATGNTVGRNFTCNCSERRKHILDRDWVIREYLMKYSYSTLYQPMPSEKSTLECLKCGAKGRTRAKYVAALVSHGIHKDEPRRTLRYFEDQEIKDMLS